MFSTANTKARPQPDAVLNQFFPPNSHKLLSQDAFWFSSHPLPYRQSQHFVPILRSPIRDTCPPFITVTQSATTINYQLFCNRISGSTASFSASPFGFPLQMSHHHCSILIYHHSVARPGSTGLSHLRFFSWVRHLSLARGRLPTTRTSCILCSLLTSKYTCLQLTLFSDFCTSGSAVYVYLT